MEKIKFKYNYSFLPNKPENVVLNTFINASVKTFGFVVGLQAFFFIYWKTLMPVGKAIKFLMFKPLLILPFSYYWYRKLKASTYQELDKLNINTTFIVKDVDLPIVKTEEVNEKLNIIETIKEVESVKRIVDEIQTVKDKLHVSYVLE
jgi:hypothetical protein